MPVDQASFTVIVQTLDLVNGVPTCVGFSALPAVVPVRLLVVADPAHAAWRDALVAEVVGRASATSGATGHPCDGPGGMGCFAVGESGVRHVLVVIGGDGPPSPALDAWVDSWLARGWDVLGVFRDGRNPDVVLPAAIGQQHAPSWRTDVREVAGEIVDAALTDSGERRVFISYAHDDGADTAMRLADLLSHQRFDVFLDRFRLEPGVDFVERITDELVDKAMLVVVETPASVVSPWVQQEVATGIVRRLGVAAINLVGSPTIAEIAESARCRIDDDDVLTAFVVDQHRSQMLARRESLLDSMWLSLIRTGIPPADVLSTADGYLVRRPGQPYAVTVRPRPADLHRFRLAGERANGARAVVVHPQPVRVDRRRDIEWLAGGVGIEEVDEGLMDEAADQIAAGTL